jgi:hypothetical protein
LNAYVLLVHAAYRIDPDQALLRKTDAGRMAGIDEFDANDLLPCYVTPSGILCNQFDRHSRRDTGFLRFGRKR